MLKKEYRFYSATTTFLRSRVLDSMPLSSSALSSRLASPLTTSTLLFASFRGLWGRASNDTFLLLSSSSSGGVSTCWTRNRLFPNVVKVGASRLATASSWQSRRKDLLDVKALGLGGRSSLSLLRACLRPPADSFFLLCFSILGRWYRIFRFTLQVKFEVLGRDFSEWRLKENLNNSCLSIKWRHFKARKWWN